MSEKDNIKNQATVKPDYDSLEWKAAAIERRNARQAANAIPAKPIKYCVSMNGNLICLSQYNPNKPREATAKRGKVTKFSDKSRANLLKYTRGIPKDRYKVDVQRRANRRKKPS
jgi:hypothetical protein